MKPGFCRMRFNLFYKNSKTRSGCQENFLSFLRYFLHQKGFQLHLKTVNIVVEKLHFMFAAYANISVSM